MTYMTNILLTVAELKRVSGSTRGAREKRIRQGKGRKCVRGGGAYGCMCACVQTYVWEGLRQEEGEYISDSHSYSTLKDTHSFTPTPKPEQLDRDAPPYRRPTTGEDFGFKLKVAFFLKKKKNTFRRETPVFFPEVVSPSWPPHAGSVDYREGGRCSQTECVRRARTSNKWMRRKTNAGRQKPHSWRTDRSSETDELRWARLMITHTLCRSSGDFFFFFFTVVKIHCLWD